MSTVLDRISATVEARDLRVRKAMPRGPDHLLLVLSRADGTRVAGQWFAEPAVTRHVAAQTRASTGGSVEIPVLPGSGVLLQPQGADRRLPALFRLAGEPGAILFAHRAERRGVVRHVDPDGQVAYTKSVRPDRLAAMVTRAAVRVPGVSIPRLTASDAAAGTMTCTALPGRTLQELLDDPAVPMDDLLAAGRAVGEAVARLHATIPPASAGLHDAAAEIAVTRGWLRRAAAYGVLDDTSTPVREALDAALHLLAEPACEPAYLHRDLHDMQLLVDEHGKVGMLDFDLSTTGEAALDLANLLVHLELHAIHASCARGRATGCAEAVVQAYAPTTDVWRRVPAYALCTRLRLAAVNAFRPPRAHLAQTLLTEHPPGPLQELEERR